MYLEDTKITSTGSKRSGLTKFRAGLGILRIFTHAMLDAALPLLARLLLTKFRDRLCCTTIGIYRKFVIIYSTRGSGQIKSETMIHYRPKEPVKLQKGLIHHVIINARHNFIKQQD